MSRKFTDEECAAPKVCPQIPHDHRVTLQYLGFLMLKVAPGQCVINGRGEENIPALTEAQLMSPGKGFQTPGNF